MRRWISYGNRLITMVFSIVIFFSMGGCEKAFDLKPAATDPVSIFNEAWNMMDRRYALFSIKGVDWKEKYQAFRPQVASGMSEHDLFRVIGRMFETLYDGHVALVSPIDTAVYDNFYKAYPANFNYSNVLTKYLKNDYKTSGPVIYKIEDNIAYLYYGSFYNDISDEEMDKLFGDIKQAKALIVDVRSNSGGNSRNADKLFRRFIAQKKLVKYELAKKGPAHDDFSLPSPFYLLPEGEVYAKPVVVLTNRACFSACNDFVSYMSGLPNVKLMGDQTGGGGGIPHDYLLANGWKIQYTATMTLSADKIYIEPGIQPDVNIGISSLDDANGRDTILEKAFQSLQ